MAPEVAPPGEEHEKLDPTKLRAATGYMPIENYGLIGNMRTAALVAKDGAMDFLCWPNFDSPSDHLTTKQQYLPSSNVLQTMHFQEKGVMKLEDFFPRPRDMKPLAVQEDNERHDKLRKWVVRRVECLRGEINVCVRCAPAFNYARDSHTMEIKTQENVLGGEQAQYVVFHSKGLDLEIRATCDRGNCDQEKPQVNFERSDRGDDMLGPAYVANLHLKEGQRVSFILRDHVSEDEKPERSTSKLLDRIGEETRKYWFSWIQKCHCTGRFQEVVQRSLFTLKLLTFEPTGAIVAAPTFSLPELFGGSRNWDYRFSWVRDSSFTIYILLRMGFREEAEAYMNFIEQRILHDKTADGALPTMFSIHGKTDIPEIELSHLSGYRGSAPVRIGNGAATHKQLDIYGELMDGMGMTDYVCSTWHEKDMSIWEVRGEVQNFVYSKVMLWVAVDRALRLAEKRCFPCPNREHWLRTRDSIMEEVMDKGYNKQMRCFIQSYEHPDVLDSALLIAPLVFFIAPNDPRFLSTLEEIMLPIEKGGLTSAGMVHRYNTRFSNDGVGGEEGAFSMCTFWLIEALTRAGQYDDKYLERAITLFENTLGFANHVGLFSEEINNFGEQLGNTPQAFSHLALISAAFNLDRVSKGGGM
ncbi:Six-hairpin glycosidase [Teratosphaeria nubilosa]|uniref:Six-hairpin glycosidase n=1 Tax=Teratosphaeria nubilosa TaxID=161662 RepID=A0A6G1LCR9_9PEZI|nr:Six-hairpin glycosidase [Teratosphaeria nubilosa]